MCYNQTGDISTIDRTPFKLVDKFTYLGGSIASTKKDIDTRLTKTWTAINRLSIIWKSDLIDKMKRSFFQAAVASILLYGCTTCVIFWPSTRPKNAIPRWYTGRKWHIPMASNRKRSRGRIKANNMGQGEGPTLPIQTDAPEESDLWTAWQLFPLDDD